MKTYKHKELTDQIIQAFYDVYNELGYGFLENVYQNALYFELQNRKLKVESSNGLKAQINSAQRQRLGSG